MKFPAVIKAKHLRVGDLLLTEHGYREVVSVEPTDYGEANLFVNLDVPDRLEMRRHEKVLVLKWGWR